MGVVGACGEVGACSITTRYLGRLEDFEYYEEDFVLIVFISRDLKEECN